jgi:hypothetical protein
MHVTKYCAHKCREGVKTWPTETSYTKGVTNEGQQSSHMRKQLLQTNHKLHAFLCSVTPLKAHLMISDIQVQLHAWT